MKKLICLVILALSLVACTGTAPPTGQLPSTATEAVPTVVTEEKEKSGILPANILILDGRDAIRELDVNGDTVETWVVNGRAAKAFSYTSARQTLAWTDGSQVYLNQKTDPSNAEAFVSKANIKNVLWAPNGTLLAVNTSQATVLLDTTGEEIATINGNFNVLSWSADSARLVLANAIGNGFLVYTVAGGVETILNVPTNCCAAHWTQSGRFLYISNNIPDAGQAGVWLVSAISGTPIHLLSSKAGQTQLLAADLRHFPNDSLYGFFGDNIGLGSNTPLTMHSISADGQQDLLPLRNDSHRLRSAVWDPTGRGALIITRTANLNDNALIWLSIDNAPAATIANAIQQVQWLEN